jgi:GrpB-like predicted nucleotidyltransferase (UPF0157 family)
MNDVLIGGVEKREIVLVDYNPLWPEKFQKHAAILSQALGARALSIEHVGSTSVPGLAAKPIIDIIVQVENSGDELAYLPALLAAGYVLRVCEPGWHQHRMVRTPELDVHIHIFSIGCIEVTRQLAFRDHLRNNADARLLYESTKRKLSKEDWPDMEAYARAKTAVVEQITAKALQETGSA